MNRCANLIGFVAAVLGIGICASGARGSTLRIVSYNIDCADQGSINNITNSTHSIPTVIQAIGLHHIGTNAQPVDMLGVTELTSTTLSALVAQLNIIYGAGTYTFDPTTDPNTGGGPDGLIYRTNTVQVVSARALLTGQNVLLQSNGTYTAANSPGGGVNGVTRAPMLYRLRPVGFGSNYDFYMYVSHARSTSDDSVGDARYAEAQEVRSDAKYKLPAGAHILYSGDWNLFAGSGENAYKCLTGQTTTDGTNWSDTSAIWANTNQTQAYDPMSKTQPPTTVTWGNVAGDNATYLYGDSTAHLTSRIDMQLPNALMFSVYNSQGGVQLAPDTSDPFDTSNFPSSQYPYAFETFGNNGTTPRSSSPTSSANHSLDDLISTVPSAATVYADLLLTGSGSNFTGSDHYPIVGDYIILNGASPPVASFIAGPTNGNAPLSVSFTNLSTGATNYSWAFGDGNTSTLTNAANTYNNPGTYSVTLTAVGPGGTNALTRTSYILVTYPPPVAGFTASPTNGIAPLSVSFTNLSTGATNYSWAFGDGNTSTLTNAANNYLNPGTYSITLTAVGPGGTNILIRNSYILVASPPPVAGFTAGPTNGIAPLTVFFTNSSTGATNYSWAFGDGNTSVLTNAANNYLNPGTYSVTLTAVGPGGTNALTRTSYVLVASPPPVASFIAGPTNGIAPLTVFFTNSSTGATNYSWAFGDGNTSVLTNAANNYLNPGTYSVTLTAVGPGGTNTLTLVNYIVAVNPPPPSGLQLADFFLSAATDFQFIVTNTGGTPLTGAQQSHIAIYATTNLNLTFTDWAVLTNSTLLTNGLLQVNDTNSVLFPRRYYRAVYTP